MKNIINFIKGFFTKTEEKIEKEFSSEIDSINGLASVSGWDPGVAREEIGYSSDLIDDSIIEEKIPSRKRPERKKPKMKKEDSLAPEKKKKSKEKKENTEAVATEKKKKKKYYYKSKKKNVKDN